MGNFSGFLFPDSGVAEGAGRIMDFADCLNDYNHSNSAADADLNAMWADWIQNGDDLRSAMDNYRSVNRQCLGTQNVDEGGR